MKELTSVIICHRWRARPVSSARANTEQQAQLVFMSPCWQAPREGGILPLSIAQWDCANASHGSTHTPARLRISLVTAYVQGMGDAKGPRWKYWELTEPQEALGPGEGCTCICTIHPVPPGADPPQPQLPNEPPLQEARKGLWNCDLLAHGAHPEVMPCLHQTHLLEARAYCSSCIHKLPLMGLAQDQTQSLPNLTAGPLLSGYHPVTTCLLKPFPWHTWGRKMCRTTLLQPCPLQSPSWNPSLFCQSSWAATAHMGPRSQASKKERTIFTSIYCFV